MVKQISDNEIYLLNKYIKSVLWRVAKCLSYIEEARCLKVKVVMGQVFLQALQFSPVSIILLVLYVHAVICYRFHLNLTIKSVVK